ncbi:MAG: polyprenyl synthetase family protein [Desulfobacteraceae bacterium]|nr:polyprenyl synthetase family protein [Desulfobacteraceae bacterium]
MTFDLASYLKERQILTNNYLAMILHCFDQKRELIMAMEHSLLSGGKRLRPILSLAAAEACKENSERIALPACCAIEMIHTYSLIHDDLPAMDNDDLRRGLPTCHKKFTEATAILAGDALLTHAFYILSQPETIFEVYPDSSIRMQLISKISQAAGVMGMVEGQMLDMQSPNFKSGGNLAYLKNMHSLKTGKMITVSIESGALSVGADPETISRLTVFGDKIGLAFQVVDDILNVEGDPTRMGKSAGSDLLNEKMTFPSLMGMAASKKFAKDLRTEAIESLSLFNEKGIPLRAIADYVINRDH